MSSKFPFSLLISILLINLSYAEPDISKAEIKSYNVVNKPVKKVLQELSSLAKESLPKESKFIGFITDIEDQEISMNLSNATLGVALSAIADLTNADVVYVSNYIIIRDHTTPRIAVFSLSGRTKRLLNLSDRPTEEEIRNLLKNLKIFLPHDLQFTIDNDGEYFAFKLSRGEEAKLRAVFELIDRGLKVNLNATLATD